jgi:hypothetical protein
VKVIAPGLIAINIDLENAHDVSITERIPKSTAWMLAVVLV